MGVEFRRSRFASCRVSLSVWPLRLLKPARRAVEIKGIRPFRASYLRSFPNWLRSLPRGRNGYTKSSWTVSAWRRGSTRVACNSSHGLASTGLPNIRLPSPHWRASRSRPPISMASSAALTKLDCRVLRTRRRRPTASVACQLRLLRFRSLAPRRPGYLEAHAHRAQGVA